MKNLNIVPLTFIDTIYTNETFTINNYTSHKTIELVYVISGQLDMDYYSEDDKTVRSVTLFENQLMIIRPGVFHFQKVPNKVHMMVLEFLYDRDGLLITDFLINNDFINSIPNAKRFFMELQPVTIIIDSHNIKDNFQKLVRTLYNNYENTNNEFFEVDCLLYLMRLTVNTFKSINTNNIMKFNKHTQFVYSYIQKNYASHFSLKKLEQSTSVSSTYLNALFKKDIGQSIYSFLTEIRIKKAQNLLAEQTMSINAIATKVGFKSLRSFEIAFVKQLGITPTDYIKNIKNKNVVLWVDHDTRVIYSDSDSHFPKN